MINFCEIVINKLLLLILKINYLTLISVLDRWSCFMFNHICYEWLNNVVIWAGRCTSSLSWMVPLPTFCGVGCVHSFSSITFFYLFNFLYINTTYQKSFLFDKNDPEKKKQQSFPFLESIDLKKIIISTAWLSHSSSISLHLILEFAL